MGACLDIRAVRAKNWVELKAVFRGVVAESRYHSGRSYSGEIGMKESVVDKTSSAMTAESAPFADQQKAWDHCDLHNDKWGPAWAYRIREEQWLVGGVCSS